MSQKGEKVQKGEDFPKFKYLQCGFAFDDILVRFANVYGLFLIEIVLIYQ